MQTLQADMQILERLSGNRSWLTRTGDDLSEQLTPQLYGIVANEPADDDQGPSSDEPLSDEELGLDE
jgi:hypothetical protein